MSEAILYADQCIIKRLPYESELYFLQVGVSIGLTDKGNPVYQLVNREHNIVEGETFNMTEALNTLRSRSNNLSEALKYEEDLSPTIEGPGGSLH